MTDDLASRVSALCRSYPPLAFVVNAGFEAKIVELVESQDAKPLLIPFGLGAVVVGVGTYNDQPMVSIEPASENGIVGEKAPNEDPAKLTPRAVAMLFPTAEQAHRVVEALTTRSEESERKPAPSDPDLARIRELAEKAGAEEWAYRPGKHDDWGMVRGPSDHEGFGWIVAVARPGRFMSDEEEADFRARKADPCEAKGRYIAAMHPAKAIEIIERCERAGEAADEARETSLHAEAETECVIFDAAQMSARIAALEAKLSGMAPRDPTDTMLIAARDWSYREYGKPIGNDAAIKCWHTMYDAALSAVPLADPCVIFSGEHMAYWRPKACGYTTILERAGVYERPEAEAHTRGCGPEKKIQVLAVRLATMTVPELIEGVDRAR